MRPKRPRRGLAGIALLALVGTGVCGTAFAYFTATGAGSASADVSKLAAPTISSATAAAGGTVALSWSAVTAPGPGPVTYTVSRDGEAPDGTCPSLESPAPVTSCTDAELAIGTHTYTVTAKWRSWTATSSPATAKVTVGEATRLTLGAATTTPVAGAADNLTITAKDVAGSTVTTYSGAHNLVFSGAASSPGGTAPTVANSAGTATAFGSATAINFTLGVATVTSGKNGAMKLYNAGSSSVSVSDGSISSEPGLAITVAPATQSKLALAAASTTPAAGEADNLTVTAQDAYGNTTPSYTGSHNLTFSGASASPNGEIPTVTDSTGAATAFGSATTVEFTAGAASVSGSKNGLMKLYRSGATSLKVTDGTLTSATSTVTVAAAVAAKLSLSAASTTPTAGASDNLTTTALDPYGNTATAYAGSHNLTFSGASTSPNGTAPTVASSGGTAIPFGSTTAIEFTAGVAKVASSKNGIMKLNKAETASVSVSDGTISTPAGLAIAVSPAAAAKFALTHVTASAGSIGASCLFTCTVTSLGNSGTIKANVAVTDSLGNTVSALGSGHAAKVTSTGGTIVGTPLAIPATGTAESTTQFTYTSKSSGSFTDTITAATSEGTAYTSATATASK
jgi:hypothetical protein